MSSSPPPTPKSLSRHQALAALGVLISAALTMVFSLINVNQSCNPIANAAVYIWHCDKDGAYSGDSSSANGNHSGETFLRGIQVTDANGQVSFTTIYPGWYGGRITHVHFQIYVNNNKNVAATATSQMAFPQAVAQAVYASSLHSRPQSA